LELSKKRTKIFMLCDLLKKKVKFLVTFFSYARLPHETYFDLQLSQNFFLLETGVLIFAYFFRMISGMFKP
jgi:hypothetical protein